MRQLSPPPHFHISVVCQLNSVVRTKKNRVCRCRFWVWYLVVGLIPSCVLVLRSIDSLVLIFLFSFSWCIETCNKYQTSGRAEAGRADERTAHPLLVDGLSVSVMHNLVHSMRAIISTTRNFRKLALYTVYSYTKYSSFFFLLFLFSFHPPVDG